MFAIRDLRDGLTDDSLRFALLVGLATIPFTVALSWEPVSDEVVVVGGSVSGAPLLLAGLLVGYYYSGRATESRRAGIWTGLAASIGAVVVFLANAYTTIGSASPRMAAVAVVLSPLTVAIGVGLTVLVTMITALISDWVTTRVDRDRRVAETDDSNAVGSRWWQLIAVYILLAPVVVLYILWVNPDSGVGFGLSVLGLLVVAPLSIVTLIGLFIDATAPRAVETGWFPNVWFYVGVPLGVYALVYLGATLRDVVTPSGAGMYGFIGALWIASVIYLVSRHRSLGTLGTGGSAAR